MLFSLVSTITVISTHFISDGDGGGGDGGDVGGGDGGGGCVDGGVATSRKGRKLRFGMLTVLTNIGSTTVLW